MGPINVVVQDANNLVLEVTPTPDTSITLDRGVVGPAGIIWKGNWSSATLYIPNDAVFNSANNSSYICIAENTNQQPPNATYWDLLVTGFAGGDVAGPASSTDNAVVRFDGTTGKLIQNSNVLIDDSGNLTYSAGTANGVAYLNGSKVLTIGSALTFDGTNLGVGTSSPSTPLTFGKAVYGGVGSEDFYRIKLQDLGGTANDVGIGQPSSGSMGFNIDPFGFYQWNAGTDGEIMRIDSSGNLGLGVTPSAWGGSFKALDFGSIGSLTTNGAASIIGSNLFVNSGGSLIYKTTAAASYFQQQAGAFSWYTAPSGTAGNAISFTQAMTLDASGNLFTNNGKIGPNATQQHTMPAVASDTYTLNNATQTLSNKTLNGVILNDGYTEEVFAVTGTTPALSPTNGSIQTWTLTGNRTPTAGTWAAGQSMTLMINDSASAFTVTWTSLPVVWVGGSAPTLAPAGGNTVIVLWKVGTTIYGALTGQVA